MVLNVAFYKFVDLQDVPVLRESFKKVCADLRLKGTILLSPEGINGFVAGAPESVNEFRGWLAARPEFSGMEFKESWSQVQPFGRMLVKLKKEIISFGIPGVQPARKTGRRLEAKELKRWLDERRDIAVVDTRNDYEIQLGTFEGALDLGLKTFRQFPEKLRDLPSSLKKKPVVMFCTGGIRCEKATALAMDYGFEEVYQLEGGILKYFEECGRAHYQGDCFVFDHRIALEGDLAQAGMIQCIRCRNPFRIEDQSGCRACPAQVT